MIWLLLFLYLIAGLLYAGHWVDDDGKLQGPEDLIALAFVIAFWPLVALGELIDLT